jgi:hypothetical protein
VGEVQDMDEDGPNDSPYEMLAKYDQSETKHDTVSVTSQRLVLLDLSVFGYLVF